MNQRIVETLRATYRTRYRHEPLLVRAPGRVNIIGEHTDYNDGFVLPAAIDKAIYVAIGRRTDQEIHLHAQAFQAEVVTHVSYVQRNENSWANYPLGIVRELQQNGCHVGGFNLIFDGDIPIGAGLSSSAAVECASIFALNAVFQLGIFRLDMARMAQRAEQNFAGVMCGIMDQFASLFGKKDHVFKLDCRSLAYEYAPLRLDGYEIVLLNTNVEHELSTSEFNTRRAECELGVRWLQERYPQVNALRDATVTMLKEVVEPKDTVIFRRCLYVVQEIERLLGAYADLQRNDLKALGRKMFQTHDGLSKLYEVSCPELDFLVDAVRENPEVVGARMMGGGFGGCTINIVRADAVEALIETITHRYRQATGRELSAYIARAEDGVETLP